MTQSLYQDHFGIRENPFSIIPDPHYLFMSQRHQEALAHLLYGVSESGGFVLLSGEVGTGKTTICRALIEQLPENVDLALILNPKLDGPELMAAICDEMRIPYPLGTTSLKDFFDFMNRHLLEAHARGRNPVLMIDEAQNLSDEVLELIRLLTNLETAEKKLLQIILVGQPELNHLLAQPQHRQTAQRITARYHLFPLGLVETRAYVEHRLRVAGLEAHVFTNGAVKAVHKAARGIPRLINSICDRALLAAYVEGHHQINRKLAFSAAQEVLGTQGVASGKSVWGWLVVALMIFAVIFVLGFDLLNLGLRDKMAAWLPASKQVEAPAQPTPEPAPEPEPMPEPIPEPMPEPMPEPEALPGDAAMVEPVSEDLDETGKPSGALAPAGFEGREGEDISRAEGTFVGEMIQSGTPDVAFANLFAMWDQDYLKARGLTPCDKAQGLPKGQKLSCGQGTTDLKGLKAMNRPAVVSIVMPDGEHLYGVVKRIGADDITIDLGARDLNMSISAFKLRWAGDYLVVWQPIKGIERALTFGQQGPDVQVLRRLLAQANFADGPQDIDGQGSVFFGPSLREKVRAFQSEHGLEADGIAGPASILYITGVAGQLTIDPIVVPPPQGEGN